MRSKGSRSQMPSGSFWRSRASSAEPSPSRSRLPRRPAPTRRVHARRRAEPRRAVAGGADNEPVTERPARIVLVGMMGSGKTSVGRAVAARLGWPLLDNDAQILAATGRPSPTIFREGGEDALHEAERQAFRDAVA